MVVAIPSNRVNVSYKTKFSASRISLLPSESQSPQIGSMFLTHAAEAEGGELVYVAIPSNRVNVSYLLTLRRHLIGAERGRNPLKSGQCFLRFVIVFWLLSWIVCRNPLKSGQCFLHKKAFCYFENWIWVAIPSNRVNVSYIVLIISILGILFLVAIPSNRVNVSYLNAYRVVVLETRRNPLKSGQCFLLESNLSSNNAIKIAQSQSPQIGSMFLTEKKVVQKIAHKFEQVAIPSNRVNVSYFLLYKKKGGQKWVAIPSNRVNVSYLVISKIVKW